MKRTTEWMLVGGSLTAIVTLAVMGATMLLQSSERGDLEDIFDCHKTVMDD